MRGAALFTLSLVAACQVDTGKHTNAPPTPSDAARSAMLPPLAAPTTATGPTKVVADVQPDRRPPPSPWSTDDGANRETLALFDRFGVRSELEREHWMDGGFRGKIHIVPTEPIGAERKHLPWITTAYERMTAWLKSMATLAPGHRYRVTPITLRFFVSENRTTPSAYAIDWSIAYNLRGSLLQSEVGVHETFVHETFHLNDQAHNDWAARTMSELYREIRNRCATNSACFAPYSPGTTMVRGGTYYAFHAGNDVREYAAELMVRFYKEADLAFRSKSTPKTAKFKCGPQENKRAWEGLVNEFFDGKDPVPAC